MLLNVPREKQLNLWLRLQQRLICQRKHQRGHAVAQFVQALCYKPVGPGFESD
jgi:hypothetical protein